MYRDRLAALKVVGDPIEFRKVEVTRRDAVQEKVSKFEQLTSAAIASWPTDRPWINASDITAFSKQVCCH